MGTRLLAGFLCSGTMQEYKLIVIFVTQTEVVSESVETQFDAVVDSDRTAEDYADAARIPADEVEYEG
jgi:hypothetical protein